MAIKRNGVLKGYNKDALKNMMLTERSQTQKAMLHNVIYMK